MQRTALAVGLVLLAGCASQSAFEAAASEAPALLAQDMGPSGTLRLLNGTSSTAMRMTMQDQTIDIEMTLDARHEFFLGARLATMELKSMQVGYQDLDGLGIRILVFCAPGAFKVRSSGMAALNSPELDVDVRDAGISCGTWRLPASVAGNLSLAESTLLQNMRRQGAVPELTFSHADEAAQEAVYTTRIEVGQPEMGMAFVSESRARLDGPRIVHLDLDGNGKLSGGTATNHVQATLTVAGHMDFEYGERAPVPAEWA